MKKEKINLVVNEPIDLGNGCFKTTLTNPLLNGELSFIHGAENRDQTLMSLSNSLVDDIKDIVTTLGELTGKTKR